MNFVISLNKTISALMRSEYDGNSQFADDYILLDKSFSVFKTGTKIVCFSGIIYNGSEIDSKKENTAEVIFDLIDKKGINGLKILDGKYTIIIKDNNSYKIIRDRHGVNSQVYYNNDYVVSHQNIFLKLDGFKPEPNFETIALFLKIGYIPSPETALIGVSKLPAGFILEFNDNKFVTRDLYPYSEYEITNEARKMTEDEATEHYKFLHQKSLKNRVSGAEHVQILLSGGYDSGGNIEAIRQVFNGDVSSYSIGFKGNPWSELPLAKLMSNVYKTTHYEYEIEGKEIEDLPEIINEFGDPFNESGMMVNYTALRLVKGTGNKAIIIGGDGNDQHFGTAGRELALNYKYRKNGFSIIQNMINSVSDMSMFNKDNMFFKVRFHNSKISNILQSDNFGFRDKDISKLLKNKVDTKNVSYLNDLPKNITDFQDLFKIHNYYSDIKQVIDEIIMFKASRFSQSNGLDMAFPYMSTDIYNFLKTLPINLKIKGSIDDLAKGRAVSKYLHKNYLKNNLPKEITQRKKQGGFAPLPIFFIDDKRYDKIHNYILNSSIAKQMFNKNVLSEILNNYKENKNKEAYWFWYKQVQAFRIFNLLVIAVWWDLTIEHKKADTLSQLFN